MSVKLEKAVLREIFDDEYYRMSDGYVVRVLRFCDAYLETEAGQQFAKAVTLARKRKSSIPILNIETLKSFKDRPGISWDLAEVFEFFEPLHTCAETTEKV